MSWYTIPPLEEYLAITGALQFVSTQTSDYEMNIQSLTRDKFQFMLPAIFAIGPDTTQQASGDVGNIGDSGEHNGDTLTKYEMLLADRSKSDISFKEKYVQNIVKSIIEEETRVVVGSMTIKDIFIERDAFKERIIRNIQAELDPLGLKIHSFKVRWICDAPDSKSFASISHLNERSYFETTIQTPNPSSEIATPQETRDLEIDTRIPLVSRPIYYGESLESDLANLLEPKPLIAFSRSPPLIVPEPPKDGSVLTIHDLMQYTIAKKGKNKLRRNVQSAVAGGTTAKMTSTPVPYHLEFCKKELERYGLDNEQRQGNDIPRLLKDSLLSVGNEERQAVHSLLHKSKLQGLATDHSALLDELANFMSSGSEVTQELENLQTLHRLSPSLESITGSYLAAFLLYRKSPIAAKAAFIGALLRSVLASNTTNPDVGPTGTGFKEYWKELWSHFVSNQAGPLFSHTIWALVLGGIFLVIQHHNKNAQRSKSRSESASTTSPVEGHENKNNDRPATLAILILVSNVATLFGGHKYHLNSKASLVFESNMSDAALLIAMLFNSALIALYGKSTLDQFKLGRLHTGLIVSLGTAFAYFSAVVALYLLDEVKGRYGNKTALFLTLVVPWTSAVAFMYLAALADTSLGEDLDKGIYTEGFFGLLKFVFHAGFVTKIGAGADVDLERGGVGQITGPDQSQTTATDTSLAGVMMRAAGRGGDTA